MEPLMQIEQNIYDQAQQHLGTGFPESLPMEQAYVHIGMYLGWIIESGFYSEYFSEEASTEIFRFKRKEISCTILSEVWNGYLAFEFFDKTGNNFSLFYYTSGLYRKDYEEILGRDLPTIYHVEDTWPNYDKLKMRINARYEEWQTLKTLLKGPNTQGPPEGSNLRVAV
jgi:hypothetical protein